MKTAPADLVVETNPDPKPVRPDHANYRGWRAAIEEDGCWSARVQTSSGPIYLFRADFDDGGDPIRFIGSPPSRTCASLSGGRSEAAILGALTGGRLVAGKEIVEAVRLLLTVNELLP